jgi:hypothetical protein
MTSSNHAKVFSKLHGAILAHRTARHFLPSPGAAPHRFLAPFLLSVFGTDYFLTDDFKAVTVRSICH